MSKARRLTGIALAALLAVIGLLAVFDEVWIRPLVQRYVRSHAGRAIDFSGVSFRIDAHGRPVLRVRDLMIENAPWAAAEPLIKAGLLEATFDWSTLKSDRVIFDRLRIVDASLDLERQADGLRNFRIANPQDRGPGKVRIRSLDAERTRLRFVHRGLGLELNLQGSALPAVPGAAASGALPTTRSIVGQGVRDGLPFQVRLETGDLISLYDTETLFPLRGELRTAHARLEIDGRAHDLFQLGGLDLHLHATGAPGSGLGEIATVARGAAGVPAWLPSLASDVAAVRLNKEGRQWRIEGLTARLGRSDLAGDVAYREPSRGDEAPRIASWQAKLTSDRIDLGELRTTPVRPAAGASEGRKAGASKGLAAGSATGPASGPASAAVPSAALAPSTPALTGTPKRPPRLEATLAWTVRTIDGVPRGPVTGLRFAGSVEAGVWKASTLAFGLADGQVAGSASYDTGASPAALSGQARIDGASLERLGIRKALGRIDAHAALRSSGDTVPALLANIGGKVTGALAGASLPASLDAELGLDGGRWLRSLFDRSGRSAITCSAFDFVLERGVARARTLALETDALLLTGTGTVDLPTRSLDLTLTPHRRQFALLALDRSIRLHGALRKPSISLVDRSAEAGPARCVPMPAHG